MAYGGWALNSAEKNYTTTEKEILAVVFAIEKFRPFLYGNHFTVMTDHAAIKSILALKDPKGRLARWVMKLQDYQFSIIHKAGINNGDADGLSRRQYSDFINPIAVCTLNNESPVTLAQIVQMQKKDTTLATIMDYLNSGALPVNDNDARIILLSHDN